MDRNGLILAREEIQAIVKQLDYIGNGTISYTEFLVAAINKKRFIDKEAIWEVFKYFDRDNDGMITKADLRAALE